jgi:hypothetical protein
VHLSRPNVALEEKQVTCAPANFNRFHTNRPFLHQPQVFTSTASFHTNRKFSHQPQVFASTASFQKSHVQPTVLLASIDQALQGWTLIACKGIRTAAYKLISYI